MFLVITANATILNGGLEIEFLISCLTNVLALLGQCAVLFIYHKVANQSRLKKKNSNLPAARVERYLDAICLPTELKRAESIGAQARRQRCLRSDLNGSNWNLEVLVLWREGNRRTRRNPSEPEGGGYSPV